jgi:hypothetical protein
MSMLGERTDVREDTKPTEPGDADQRHYFLKKDLDRNLLEGVPIRAICGFVKEGLANPAAGAPVCERCKWLHRNVMQPGDDE